ncbi:MAG: DSD1 family PLP-dependent enzyme [Gammaproteobacteria bacterium]|nr:DSD1 family PLP-dependent enzyme [Gammaproteobacteria bacterium]
MTQPAPAEVGMSIEDVDTPALIIDLDAFEANLTKMADAAKAAGVRVRPHAKSHKCAAIALRQMALGAIGVCCQKVSEAEALVRNGVDNVLISNQIVGERKLRRMAALTDNAAIGVCVDHRDNVRAIGVAATQAGTSIDVLVEIDVGANRCGVPPGAPALELAKAVADTSGLRFAGLQAYQGRAQHIRSFEARRDAIQSATQQTQETVNALSAAGLECETIGGAGTGTFQFEAASGLYNELQVGSYVFMDADYALNLAADGAPISDFQHSLFLYSTVMSYPDTDRAVVDAGLKAMSFDSGMPTVHQRAGIEYVSASDEHGKISLSGVNDLRLGDKLLMVPGHCDPTVNMHDWYVCVRGGVVEALWPIVARGALF